MTESIFGDVIHQYTRAQALADGELVDAGDLAREAGFRVPVALTRAAWLEAVAWDSERPEMQDETGRLWDVLTMSRFAAGRASYSTDRCIVRLYRVPNEDRGRDYNEAEQIELRMHIGPGDSGEPVVTILLPHED